MDNLNDRVKHLAIMFNELVQLFDPIKSSINNFDEETKAKLGNKL